MPGFAKEAAFSINLLLMTSTFHLLCLFTRWLILSATCQLPAFFTSSVQISLIREKPTISSLLVSSVHSFNLGSNFLDHYRTKRQGHTRVVSIREEGFRTKPLLFFESSLPRSKNYADEITISFYNQVAINWNILQVCYTRDPKKVSRSK